MRQTSLSSVALRAHSRQTRLLRLPPEITIRLFLTHLTLSSLASTQTHPHVTTPTAVISGSSLTHQLMWAACLRRMSFGPVQGGMIDLSRRDLFHNRYRFFLGHFRYQFNLILIDLKFGLPLIDLLCMACQYFLAAKGYFLIK